MENRGEVVAVERHPGRAAALERTCERMRASIVRVVVADAVSFTDEAGFDRILLDPPCTGLGTLQSHPDLRWRVQPQDIEQLAALQDAMLDAGARCCGPAGASSTRSARCRPAKNACKAHDCWRTLPSEDGTDGFYSAADGG